MRLCRNYNLQQQTLRRFGARNGLLITARHMIRERFLETRLDGADLVLHNLDRLGE